MGARCTLKILYFRIQLSCLSVDLQLHLLYDFLKRRFGGDNDGTKWSGSNQPVGIVKI